MKMVRIVLLFLLFASAAKAQQVSYPSRSSLLVRIFADTVYLGSATGFVTEVNHRFFFVTSWHVVTNREYNMMGMPLMSSYIPDRLWVFFNRDSAGTFKQMKMPLFDEKGGRKWHELRYNDSMLADVAAIEIKAPEGVKLFPVDITPLPLLQAMDKVVIVGFPFGIRSVGFWPLYKQGIVASEPQFDYDGKPAFLIDANTKPGMSGSPVYAADGKRCIGLYAAQETLQDIGVVWKAAFIYEQLKKIAR